MDNLCHTLTGAALGRAGLASATRYGMVTLMAAANLPDIDVVVFATDTLPVSFRRGWTHGVLAQLLLPIVLAVIVWTIGRMRSPRAPAAGETREPAPPLRLSALLALAYAGVLSHVFLDFLNSYGIRLLMPFSNRWFYGDALYIVDPFMWWCWAPVFRWAYSPDWDSAAISFRGTEPWGRPRVTEPGCKPCRCGASRASWSHRSSRPGC